MRTARFIGLLARFRSPKSIVCFCGLLAAGAFPAQAGEVNVTTYHNNAWRSGWNANETALTPSTVSGGSFKQLATVQLDDQVDAEPLYVAKQTLTGLGVHDTLYVATEGNSVYAIDAKTGQILIHRNFGAPVPVSAVPGGCPNNIKGVGINSTPVIDLANRTLYVVVFNYINNVPSYFVHTLDLATLKDKRPRVPIQASATLSDGTVFNFNASTSRQRAALLLNKGTVYAAFTSFCDNVPSKTRGWVLGWQTDTLNSRARILTNKLATSPKNYFLSTIWMSGYGLAADAFGSVYFVTGNSDPQSTQYYPNNWAESVVKMKPDLSAVQSYFTPGTAANGREALDKVDNDFGAGGAMIIPLQPGKDRFLAVAAGKVGIMYLMNQQALGGYTNGADRVLQTVNIGPCFCGPSYYRGSDGVGRVVSSGGNQVKVWKIVTSANAKPQLVQESESAPITSGQSSGFFTSVTSNATRAGSQIIWALSRPTTLNPAGIQLYAFDPNAGGGQAKTLFVGNAGQWPNGDGNANLVPMVADGHVYVASYKELTIFGLGTAGAAVKTVTEKVARAEQSEPALPGHTVYGKLIAADNKTLTLETRTGKHLTVDPATARKNETENLPVVGEAYLARGEYDQQGVLHAVAVQRVKDQPELWKPDN